MFSSLLRGKSKFSFCLECGVGDFKGDGNADLVRQNTTKVERMFTADEVSGTVRRKTLTLLKAKIVAFGSSRE
jgi:hypothetical protein